MNTYRCLHWYEHKYFIIWYATFNAASVACFYTVCFSRLKMLLEGLVPEYQTISKVKLFWIIATQSYSPQVISWLFCKVTSQTIYIMTLRNDIEDPKFRRRNNISSIFVICFCDEKVCSNKQIEQSSLWINLWKERQRQIKINDFVFLFSLNGNLNKMWWIVE